MRNDLSLGSVLKGLKTNLIGKNILYYPSIPSTMLIARRIAEEGAVEGTIIIADEQTAGRGRLGREWLSPPNSSISLSIILRPNVAQLPQLNMAASLAVVRSIEEVTGLTPAIKWPNDVLLNGKKVSGILIENILEGRDLSAAIVGIGVNVGLDLSSFPDISAVATSLSTELGREVSRRGVLLSLINEFEQLYQELRCDRSIYEMWLTRVETLKKAVRVKSGDAIEEGYVESINTDGSLVLRRPDGSMITMVAGEVTMHI
jgi:BirA family biotin operon repressor/biotin-[acetyl-CoA-carboxylase] ligase